MKILGVFCVSFFLAISSAHAELTIRITQGVDNPTAISVVPFNFTGKDKLSENISAIVSNDLERSGQFGPISPEDMLSYPFVPQDVAYRDWRLLGSEYLVIGNIDPVDTGYKLTFSLFDVLSQQALLFNNTVTVEANGLRDMAHYVSDKVYEAITGIRGAFSTDIIYVEHQKQSGKYRLIRADMDGYRPEVLLTSPEPIISPSWSPDGTKVAYVSFEINRRPAIFIQDLATGKEQQLTNFRGINGAPAWSPDGRKLAMVLSKDGNPEIYTLDLGTRQFTRLTNHFGIDTEPAWSVDGRMVMFTSSRGGKPQIYQVPAEGGAVQRLTFDGNYNARAQPSPDGKSIVIVHGNNNVFHIATQDLETGRLRILTEETSLDESPSIAPNGASLIYATKIGSKGVLASVSMDAGTRFVIPSTSGDVREPAWSPYLEK